jgi:hypothetical protein
MASRRMSWLHDVDGSYQSHLQLVLGRKKGEGSVLRIKRMKMTNDHVSHCSSFGCHVAVGDVAPAIGVRKEKGGGESISLRK